MVTSTEIDVQPFKIDVPRARGSQIDGKLRSVDAEYSSSAGDRLSDTEEFQEDELRWGIQANAVRNVVFLGRKKGQQPVGFDSYITGLAEHTMHGSSERMGRYLNADRKSLEPHDGHSIAR